MNKAEKRSGGSWRGAFLLVIPGSTLAGFGIGVLQGSGCVGCNRRGRWSRPVRAHDGTVLRGENASHGQTAFAI